MAKRKNSKKSKDLQSNVENYVLFGFNRDDEDIVGYLGKKHECGKAEFAIVDDIEDAVLFPDKNVDNVKGFGTPQQWMKFWNEDESLNFNFHLVKTCIS